MIHIPHPVGCLVETGSSFRSEWSACFSILLNSKSEVRF